MNHLKLYARKPEYQTRFQEISENNILPFILNNNTAVTEILLKNESDIIITDISIIDIDLPSGFTLYSACGRLNDSLDESDYILGLDHSGNPLFKELFPFESIKIRIKITSPQNPIIDFNVFSLDLGYSASLIPVSNLKTFFEFTEEFGSNVISSSYTDLTGIVHQTFNDNVISGSGRALFRYPTEKITFDSPALSESFIFFKGIVDYQESDSPIISVSNFEFGINSQRAPYVEIAGQRVTGDRYSMDYNQELSIGVSLSDTNNVLFSYNGSLIETVGSFETPEQLSISQGSVTTIGNNGSNQFYGDINCIAIYSEFKPISFHSNIASKL